MASLRVPRREGEVWLHIDRLDKQNRLVWAVQYRRRGKAVYKTALLVSWVNRCSGLTRFHGKGLRQPVAYLIFLDSEVRWMGNEAWIVQGRAK